MMMTITMTMMMMNYFPGTEYYIIHSFGACDDSNSHSQTVNQIVRVTSVSIAPVRGQDLHSEPPRYGRG